MNIDEAIAHAIEFATIQRNNEKLNRTLRNASPYINENCIKCVEEHEQLAKWLEQLKEYEDLEEQGRLIKLPCKVGDTYYSIEVNTGSCEECVHFQRGYYCDDWCTNNNVRDDNGDMLINPQYSDKAFCKNHFYEINKCCFDNVDDIFNLRKCLGKTIFLTKSEAEQKLKEMER